MATILLTDGEQRSTLAAVRSLGAAGHVVYVCSARSRSLAGASRHARKEVQVASALDAPETFAHQIRELAASLRIDVVIPMTEAAVLALLPLRESLGAYLPLPSAKAFDQICDKAAVMDAARAVGIGVPAELRLTTPAQAKTLDYGALQYPMVVKPARSVSTANGARVKRSVIPVASAQALSAALDRMPADAYPLLLQERIVGPGVGVFLLIWRGEVRAAFAHRRIREKPPSGGVSVVRESVVLEPGLLALSEKLLKRFDWEGVAMVEYKLDARTQKPYIMEINGRFWGSLQLAIDAGVDFPALLLDVIQGKPTTLPVYQHGVRTRWWWGDVDHLIARLRHSDAALALDPGAPSRNRAVLDFLAGFGPGYRNEVLRWNDPMPAVRETLDWLRGK